MRMPRLVSSSAWPPARTLPPSAELARRHADGEAADRFEGLAADRHVGADRVADRRQPGRQAAVGAAEDPVELGRQPARFGADPVRARGRRRPRSSARRRRRRRAPAQPAGLGRRVVVGEGDDRAARRPRRRCCGRRPRRARGGSRAPSTPLRCSRAQAASSGLWSMTTTISRGGSGLARRAPPRRLRGRPSASRLQAATTTEKSASATGALGRLRRLAAWRSGTSLLDRGGAGDRVLAVDAAAAARLAQDRAEDAEPVAEGVEVAGAGDPLFLVARHLGDLHPGAGDPQVDQRLHLEAGDVERDERQAARPEGVVAVAEVGEAGAVQERWRCR